MDLILFPRGETVNIPGETHGHTYVCRDIRICKEFLVLTPILPLMPDHSVENLLVHHVQRLCSALRIQRHSPTGYIKPGGRGGTGGQLGSNINCMIRATEETVSIRMSTK